MDVKQTIQWFQHYADALIKQKAYLTELDSAIGDGDHGANMARGWEAVKEALGDFNRNVGDCFMLVSKTLISKVGGASGPLYGTAFLRMGMALKGKETIAPSDWVSLLEAACQGIEQRGKVVCGEKTMYDVWKPLCEDLKQRNGFETDQSLADWLAQTAKEKAEETKHMQATKGRAAYLGERSVGHLDPGAVSTSLLFKSLQTSVSQEKE